MGFPQIDRDEARRFLALVHPPDDGLPFVVQTIHPATKRTGLLRCYATLDEVGWDELEAQQASGHRVFVELGGRTGPLPDPEHRGGEKFIASRWSLFVDADPDDHGGSKAATLDAIRRLPVALTLVVDSGRGTHAHLLLREAFQLNGDPSAVERFKAAHKALAAMAGGDAVHNLDRLAAVPGTWNTKADPPAPVRIVEFNPDRRVNLDDFDDLLVAAEDEPHASAAAEHAADAGQLDAPDDVAQLKVTDRIRKLILDPDPHVGDGKKYKSRSEAVQAVVWGLIRGGYTDEAIAEVVLGNPVGDKAREHPDGGRRYIAAEIKRARKKVKPTITGKRPVVELDDRPLRDKSDDALAALVKANAPPQLFRRAGGLARVVRDEDGRAVIKVVGEPELRGLLSRSAEFIVHTGKAALPRHTDPPVAVVRDLLALPGWPFPPLVGVTEWPCLRPDGTILTTPGYDLATRLYFDPGPDLDLPPIADVPSRDEAQDAAALVLDEVLADFPFADDASRANALALLLTPVVRPAIRGHVPMAVLDAPRRRTGKTLLASAVHTILTGRPAPLSGAPGGDDDAEWRKSLLALLLEGSTFVVADNVEGTLRSASLCRALTSDTFKDRLLGFSKTVEVPQRATFVCTGNNLSLSGDLPPRCYWIRLDPESSHPEKRTGFRHPDLLAYCAEHRAGLLAALLTMLRGWHANAKPRPDPRPLMGGFQDWADTIAGTLDFAGVQGFLRNERQWRDRQNTDEAEWERWLLAWHALYAEHAMTAKEVASNLDADDTLPGLPDAATRREFRDALPTDLAAAREKRHDTFSRVLGNALSKIESTRFGDAEVFVQRSQSSGRKAALAWVVHVARPPHGDESAVCDDQTAAE